MQAAEMTLYFSEMYSPRSAARWDGLVELARSMARHVRENRSEKIFSDPGLIFSVGSISPS